MEFKEIYSLILIGTQFFGFGVLTLMNVKANRFQKATSIKFTVAWTVLLSILSLVAPTNGDSTQFVLATLILIVCAYPLWRYLIGADEGLPFMPILCSVYAVYFAMPVFAPFDVYLRFRDVSVASNVQTLQLTLGGIVSMLTVYYGLPQRAWNSWMPQVPPVRWNERRATKATLFLGGVGIASWIITRLTTIPTALGTLFTFLDQLSLLAVVILFSLQLKRRLSSNYRIFLWAILSVRLMLDISDGLLYGLFRDFFMLLMVYLFIKRRVPWAVSCLVVGVSLVLLVSKSEFRKATWYSKNDIASDPLSKVVEYGRIIFDNPAFSNIDSLQKNMAPTVNRFDNRALFVYVVDSTPRTVPFWEGQTLTQLLWRFIPRFVWPDKPSEQYGQDFGHRYNIIDESDSGTSWNMPQIVELYANFGSIGVILGMGVFGAFYNLLKYILEEGKTSEWTQLSAILTYTLLLQVDSNITLIFGIVPFWIVLLWLIGRLIFNQKDQLGS